MSKQENVLRKVRALLAQAEDSAATPAEAEAFSAKAEELIARYAIDAALIAKREGTTEKPVARTYDIENPYALPKVVLFHIIATNSRCKLIRQGTGSNTKVTVVGYPSDLDATELLYTSLLLQATNAMLKANSGATDTRRFRTSFLYGFANTVDARLKEIARRTEGEAEASEPGTALVLRDRSRDVRSEFAALFPKSQSKKVGGGTSRAGADAGKAAGSRADLGGNRLTGSRTALTA